MNEPINPMPLGDILDRSIKITGATALRTLIVSAIFLIPACLILTIGLDIFFTSIADVLREGPAAMGSEEGMAAPMFGAVFAFMFFEILFGLGYYAAMLGNTVIACGQFEGETITWDAAVKLAFSFRFLKAIGQYILLVLAMGAIFFLPVVFLIGGTASESGGLILLGVLGMLIAGGFVMFLAFRWYFAFTSIAWEDAGVMESFRRSWELVRGNWWRVFGILLLMGIVVNFALSIILTPVYLAAFWGPISNLMQSARTMGPDIEATIQLLESMSLRIAILVLISSLVTVMITPVYTSVLFFDLRARAGEFKRRTPAPPPEAATGDTEPLPL